MDSSAWPPCWRMHRNVAEPASSHQRARGDIDLVHGKNGLVRQYQSGASRVIMPKVHDAMPEAVLINTAGGLTGGDVMNWQARAARDSELVVTTQTAERVYRSLGETARIHMKLSVEDGATLHWLPQETILFDGFDLTRHLDVELQGSAQFLMSEMLVFGRTAMQEIVRSGRLEDRWRISRNGRLCHAEMTRLGGDIQEQLKKQAVSNSAHIVCIALYTGPQAEIVSKRLASSWRPDTDRNWSWSTWQDKLVIRGIGQDAFKARKMMATYLTILRKAALPRVWQI